LILCADRTSRRYFKNDKGLQELLAAFRKMNIPFQLEVGAVKPWGKTGEKLSYWHLLTNVPSDVSSEQIALWYYYR
jgi:hypothetical protein